MSIRNWPLEDRPRDKLLIKGAKTLSDAELLAIFLRTGVAGVSAVDLARQLLVRFNGLRPLLESTQVDFCQAQGLGPAKYAQLQAVLEMARRHLGAQLLETDILSSSALVKKFLMAQLRHCKNEHMGCIFLDNKQAVIAYETLFEGTLDYATIYPRELVKRILAMNASAIILAHNHPSGHSKPSQVDIEVTHHLKKVLAALEVKLLDHMIVGGAEVVSMAEEGLLA